LKVIFRSEREQSRSKAKYKGKFFRFLLLLAWLLTAGAAYAQQAIWQGVLHNAAGAPIASAKVHEELSQVFFDPLLELQAPEPPAATTLAGDAIRCLVIEDDAGPFNPLDAPAVDTSLPLEQKPLGGLGILLIRKSVDELEYRRSGNRNVLVMKNRLTSS